MPLFTFECANCGEPVERYRDEKTDESQAFCDRECQKEFKTSNRTGEELICDWCGDEFYAHPSEIDQGRSHCSEECSERSRLSKPIQFILENSNGYPQWANGTRVHQLVAIANGADPYKVFGNDQFNIHHQNGCPLDNRPTNLELIDVSEHGVREGTKARKSYTHSDMLQIVEFFVRLNRYDLEG